MGHLLFASALPESLQQFPLVNTVLSTATAYTFFLLLCLCGRLSCTPVHLDAGAPPMAQHSSLSQRGDVGSRLGGGVGGGSVPMGGTGGGLMRGQSSRVGGGAGKGEGIGGGTAGCHPIISGMQELEQLVGAYVCVYVLLKGCLHVRKLISAMFYAWSAISNSLFD